MSFPNRDLEDEASAFRSPSEDAAQDNNDGGQEVPQDDDNPIGPIEYEDDEVRSRLTALIMISITVAASIIIIACVVWCSRRYMGSAELPSNPEGGLPLENLQDSSSDFEDRRQRRQRHRERWSSDLSVDGGGTFEEVTEDELQQSESRDEPRPSSSDTLPPPPPPRQGDDSSSDSSLPHQQEQQQAAGAEGGISVEAEVHNPPPAGASPAWDQPTPSKIRRRLPHLDRSSGTESGADSDSSSHTGSGHSSRPGSVSGFCVDSGSRSGLRDGSGGDAAASTSGGSGNQSEGAPDASCPRGDSARVTGDEIEEDPLEEPSWKKDN